MIKDYKPQKVNKDKHTKLESYIQEYIEMKALEGNFESFAGWFVENLILKNGDFGKLVLKKYKAKTLYDLWRGIIDNA